MGFRHRIKLAASALVLAGASAIVLAPTTASAAPEQPSAPSRVAHGDACTLSPESGWIGPVYYNFHNSCHWHDWCYANKPYGNTSAGRKGCDDGFRLRMRSWCSSYHTNVVARNTCYGAAETYYQAVRAFGGAFF